MSKCVRRKREIEIRKGGGGTTGRGSETEEGVDGAGQGKGVGLEEKRYIHTSASDALQMGHNGEWSKALDRQV